MLFRSDTDSVCIELMPLGSQLDTQAALRRKKSKVRLSLLSLSLPSHPASVDTGGGGQDKG